MQAFPLDPFQKEAIDAAQDSDNLKVYGPAGSGKAYTIANLILQNFLTGKTSVLIVNEDADINLFKEILASFNLSEHCQSIGEKILDHTELSRIKTNLNPENQTDFTAGFESLKMRLSYLENEIENSYNEFNKPVFGDSSLSQVIELHENHKFQYGLDFLSTYLSDHDFELNEIEYQKLKTIIEECSQIFKKEYLEFEANNLFSPSIFNQEFNEYNIIEIRNRFRELYIDLQKARQDFINYFATYKKNQKQNLEKQFTFLSKLKKEIEFKINEIELIDQIKVSKTEQKSETTSKVSFTNEKNLLASKYDELHSTFIDFKKQLLSFGLFEGYPDISKKETLPLPVIRNFVESQNDNFKNARRIINNNAEENIKRLNKHNAEDLQLTLLEAKLNELIDKVNDYDLFEENFENNALSSFKRFQFLEYLIQQLEFGFFQLQKLPGYFSWQHFWQKMDEKSRQIISHLVKIDKKYWTQTLHSWYLKMIVEKHLLPSHPSDNHLFNLHDAHANVFKDSIDSQIQNLWNTSRKKSYKYLKTEDKFLYSAIFKKNVELDWTWKSMLAKHPKLVIGAFPAVIIKKTDILSLNAPIKNQWDQLITYNLDIKNTSELKDLELIAKSRVHFTEYESETIAQNSKYKTPKDQRILRLRLVHNEFAKPINSLSLSKRLSLAKQLASKLVRANENIRIFHIRKANFISLLSRESNDVLLKSFEDKGIKESKLQGEIEAGIVEVLLDTDKSTILFLQDGLLNPMEPGSFYYQKMVMNQFREAGIIEIISWSTHAFGKHKNIFEECESVLAKLEDNGAKKIAV